MAPKKKQWQHYAGKRDRDGGGNTATDDKCGNATGSNVQQHKKKARMVAMNLGQVKGHQAVVGTCDVRNDRQATAELVDLLNAFADKVYPETDEESSSSPSAVPDSGSTDNSEGASPATPAAVDPEKAACGDAGAGTEATGGSSEQQQLSVEEMIRKEADALRAGRGKTRRFQSVNTFVKGVVMVCVVDPQVDALRLVDAMFEEIRETRKRRSRFLERVTPMQTVAFSELEAFKTAAEPMVANALPPVAEGVPPLVLPAATKAPAAPVADEPAVDASSSSSMAGVADEEGKTPVVSMAIENATQEAGEPSGSKQPSEAPAVEAATVSSAGSDVKVDGGVAPSAAAGGEGVDDDKKEATKGGGASNGASNGGSGGEGAAGGKTCDKRYRFRVDVRRRNSGLKRMDLINAVANSVGAGHSVSMATPDVTIAIEAVKSVVGASVLFNYALNHEYSISRLQDAVCGAILNS